MDWRTSSEMDQLSPELGDMQREVDGNFWGDLIDFKNVVCCKCGKQASNIGQFRMVGGEFAQDKYLGIIVSCCGMNAQIVISQKDIHRTLYVFGEPAKEIETEVVEMPSMDPESKEGIKLLMSPEKKS